MLYHCETCGKIFSDSLPKDGVKSSRGYLWHIPCANYYKDTESYTEFIDFPSPGKLIPDTIMEGQDGQD